MKFTCVKTGEVVEAERVSLKDLATVLSGSAPAPVGDVPNLKWLHKHLTFQGNMDDVKMFVFVPDSGHKKVADGDWVVDRGKDDYGRQKLEVFAPQLFAARFQEPTVSGKVAADHPDNAGTDGFAGEPAEVCAGHDQPDAIAGAMRRSLDKWRAWSRSKISAAEGATDEQLRKAVDSAVQEWIDKAGRLSAQVQQMQLRDCALARDDVGEVLAALEALCDPDGFLGAAVNAGPERDELERAMRKAGIGQPRPVARSCRLFKRAKDGDLLLFVNGKGWHSCCTGAKHMPYRRALENRVLGDFLVNGKCPTGWSEMAVGEIDEERARLERNKKGTL